MAKRIIKRPNIKILVEDEQYKPYVSDNGKEHFFSAKGSLHIQTIVDSLNDVDISSLKEGDCIITRNEVIIENGAYISNMYKANTFRLPSSAEYNYIFNTRTNAANLFGFGKVGDVKGMFVFPDDWVIPEGLTFTPTTTTCGTNVYTIEEFKRMENAGAIFLPNGFFWSSPNGPFPHKQSHTNKIHLAFFYPSNTHYSSNQYYYAWAEGTIDSDIMSGFTYRDNWEHHWTGPFRPVYSVESGAPHSFSTGVSTAIKFAKGNLLTRQNDNAICIAPNQWDTMTFLNQSSVDYIKASSTHPKSKDWSDLHNVYEYGQYVSSRTIGGYSDLHYQPNTIWMYDGETLIPTSRGISQYDIDRLAKPIPTIVAGNGINYVDDSELSVKVDNTTIGFNENGQLTLLG